MSAQNIFHNIVFVGKKLDGGYRYDHKNMRFSRLQTKATVFLKLAITRTDQIERYSHHLLGQLRSLPLP